MVIDTSAIFAVLLHEPERAEFLAKITEAPRLRVSAGTLLEAGIVAEGRGGVGGRELDVFLLRAGAEVVPVDAKQVNLARTAWRRYGEGRDRAGLNFGDLFASALARATGDQLLFKGDDFARTDTTPA